MINSRDSYVEYNPNKKESIDVPFSIGTVVELKEDPTVLAKICQYRITNEGIGQVIRVGLSYALNRIDNEQTRENLNLAFRMPQKFIVVEFTNLLDVEITTQELKKQWKKTDKIIIGKINSDKDSNKSQKTLTRKLKGY